MKRIDVMSIAVGGVILAAGIALSAYWADKFQPEPVADTADWHQIAIHQHQRAEVYKRIALAYERLDFDCLSGIGAGPAAKEEVDAYREFSDKGQESRAYSMYPYLQVRQGDQRERIQNAFQGLPRTGRDARSNYQEPVQTVEASRRLYERRSDRVKEGIWQSSHVGIAAKDKASRIVPIRKRFITPLTERLSAASSASKKSDSMMPLMSNSTAALSMGDDILPIGGKGEAWNENASVRFANWGADELPIFVELPYDTASTGPAFPAAITSTVTPQYPMPCHLPIRILSDGQLAEPCDAATGKPITAPATGQIASAVRSSIATAPSVTTAAAEASTSSLRRPSNPPEAPVVCPSDALGAVTTYWNKQSVAWYRASLAYPAGEQLPWLFQCRGDLAQRAAADASKDPSAAYDLMAWLLTWLFDHGVISRESNAWHHFTVERPPDAAGVTEVVVQFNDGWLRPGEIDRDGMNGDVYADPDCSQCEVWFFAPMMPGVASVVSWGKR